MKPYSAACDENRAPILAVLRDLLPGPAGVLEIGSGTGQHGVYFAARLPHLEWICTDLAEHHAGIRAWMQEAGLANLHGPLELDVNEPVWPVTHADAVFSANTAHIMDQRSVQAMMGGVARTLKPGGLFLLYGPFNFGGAYTSDSNRAFDAWLKQRDPASGIKDAGWLDRVGLEAGLQRIGDREMPVNNRILIWRSL
jgi:cyclopropane fatty-acyl-phospholipid synthase-like methyltransferase